MPLSQNSTHVLKNTVQWKNGKTSNATFVLFVVLLLPQGQSECESIALYKKDTNQTGNTRNRNFCCGFCFFGQFACNVATRLALLPFPRNQRTNDVFSLCLRTSFKAKSL